VITNPSLHGFEYGVLRDFEDEIVRLTSARRVEVPARRLPQFISSRIGHGTRYGGLRKLVPKAPCELRADVLWVILMGPENFTLDLYRGWDQHVGTKILYIFDTMEQHIPCIRRVLDATHWDLVITSFHGARELLEEHTQRRWHVVAQGVKLDRFTSAPPAEKIVSFCSYGRRVDRVHHAIAEFCRTSERHYEYSTAGSLRPKLDPREPYDQYAWHLNHSVFNVSWPVERTHPDRVSSFSPVTCRWFEAAAAGNIVIGEAPQDPTFGHFFGDGFVIPLGHAESADALRDQLETLWANRARLLDEACARRAALSERWAWEARVLEILALLDATQSPSQPFTATRAS
jgi:hypothetical protein